MAQYREGYELYCKKCEQFNLEPINFHYYINKLSQEQLKYYNEAAYERKFAIWQTIDKAMNTIDKYVTALN